jgi:hypothetical protein
MMIKYIIMVEPKTWLIPKDQEGDIGAVAEHI